MLNKPDSLKGKREEREYSIRMEVRAVDQGSSKPPMLRGHAAVFDQPTDIGGWFIETVKPGAFTRTIKEDDVRALFNHDPNFVLGRNISNTLRLSEDETGLAIEIDTPDTQTIRDLVLEPIRRGDVSQMSFGFMTRAVLTRTEGDVWYRDLTDLILFDVSPVTFPAYEGTDVSAARCVRSAEDIAKEFRRGPEPEPEKDLEAWKRGFEERRRRLLLAEL